jgi:hypothetical protein
MDMGLDEAGAETGPLPLNDILGGTGPASAYPVEAFSDVRQRLLCRTMNSLNPPILPQKKK